MEKIMKYLFLAYICLALSACSYYNSPPKDIPDSKILILGDSYFAIHRGLYKSLTQSGYVVNDHSMEGAQLTGKNFLYAPDIFEQYSESDFSNINTLIMNGGGNDIAFQCPDDIIDKNEWQPIVDRVFENLILLWEKIWQKNINKIIYVGYPYPPILTEKQKKVFSYFMDRLKNEYCPLNNIIFIELRDEISSEQTDFFLDDRVHPSFKTHEMMTKLLRDFL